MELDRIEIENFRSIKSEKIKIDNNCLILLGKNEAGKSNVLKAIAAVFEKYSLSKKDRRKKINNEKIEAYFVRAVLKLSYLEIKEVGDRFRGKYQNADLVKFTNGETLYRFTQGIFGEFLIRIEIGDNEEAFYSHWVDDVESYKLKQELYINGNVISLDSADGNKLNLVDLLFDIVIEMYESNPYTCHYWQYNASYLLPSSVNINNFINTPSSVAGLENIFALCNRENISEEFQNAKEEDGDYTNLLEQVSKQVTTTFQRIWKDFKGTQIQLQPDGADILIKVADKAKYSFEDRSDGFKKFICILLMLSTKSRANKIKERDIILIDEPDQSLYPTSAQYLRDELLEMSRKSIVIYSTHSQYMIDSRCLSRHIIVEKEDDVTTLKKQNENAPFSDDELLRRAIGSSIFECLKPKNIIFEGYLDREIFNKYCDFYKKQTDFKEYGSVYLGGISGAETLVQILLLANKKFIVVADSDETSKGKRTDFGKNYPEYRDHWLAYADVCGNAITMEDFITSDSIEHELKKIEPSFTYDSNKGAIQNIEKVVGKDKERKQEVKGKLAKSLKKEHIKVEYGLYIDKLKEKLEEL